MRYNEDELKDLINSNDEPLVDPIDEPAPSERSKDKPKGGFAIPKSLQRFDPRTILAQSSRTPGKHVPQTSSRHTGTHLTSSSSSKQSGAHFPQNGASSAKAHETPQDSSSKYDAWKKSSNARAYDVSQDGNLINRPGKVSPKKETEPDIGNPDIKIKFDFDSEYHDVPEDKPFRVRREKRTGCVGGILYAGFIISISLILGSLLWMWTVDVLGFGTDDESISVTVTEDMELDDLVDMLYESGIIRYRFLFRLFAEFSEAIDRISPGHYILNRNYDYRAIVQGMTARAGARVETTVMIPEGFTLAQIFVLLEDSGVVASAEDLWEVARNHDFDFEFLEETELGDRLRLEGFLFPETYNFFLDSSPVRVLNRLLNEFNRRFTEEMALRAEELGYSVREIVIIASMIEREAGSDDERSRIAAVIYNRLNNWNPPLLQIDATINYAIAGTDIPFSTALDSAFNSYIHPGLPPGPIASPGMASIMAALYPDSTNEYFYALNLEGTHNFFTNYADHRAFVNSPEFGG